jgi:hypothetical protein
VLLRDAGELHLQPGLCGAVYGRGGALREGHQPEGELRVQVRELGSRTTRSTVEGTRTGCRTTSTGEGTPTRVQNYKFS